MRRGVSSCGCSQIAAKSAFSSDMHTPRCSTRLLDPEAAGPGTVPAAAEGRVELLYSLAVRWKRGSPHVEVPQVSRVGRVEDRRHAARANRCVAEDQFP